MERKDGNAEIGKGNEFVSFEENSEQQNPRVLSRFTLSFHIFCLYLLDQVRRLKTFHILCLPEGLLENTAKDRKVIPDPIDDRKFQE